MPDDPVLERILYYAEIDRTTAQLALAVARLGQVVWQLEQARTAANGERRWDTDPDAVVVAAE